MISTITALILSLIAPGSGQIFNGHFLKGFCIAVLFMFGRTVILPLLIRIFNFGKIKTLKLIYAFNIIYPILIIIAAIDAVLNAWKMPHTLTAAAYSFVLALVIISVYHGLKNSFIIYAMSGREDVAQYIIPSKK